MKRKIWYSIISIFVVVIILMSAIICRNEIKIAVEKQKENVKQFVAKTINYLTGVATVIERWDISAKDGVDDVWATLYSDGTLVIEGTGAMKAYKRYEIGKDENGKYIYDRAPWYDLRSEIYNVEIEENITNIGDVAFYNCINLINIIIPDSVTEIGRYAFSDCSKLESVSIPDSVNEIENYTFYNCRSLNTITLPNNLVTIQSDSFQNCSALEEIDIPESVETISDSFRGCSNLKAINVDENNPNYCDENGILFNKNKTTLIRYPIKYEYENNILEDYYIPETVWKVDNYAFSECKDLKNVTFLTTNYSIYINKFAFDSCFNLVDINILNEVKNLRIYEFGFYNCYNLEKIYNIDEKNIEYIGANAFYNCKKLNGRINLLSDIKEIGTGTFSYCNNLTITKLPEKLENIGNSAFSGCINLIITELPEKLQSIGSLAFSGCTNFTITKLPEELQSIGDNAFLNCTGLTQIIIPKTTVKIGKNLFKGCTNLTSITVDEDNSVYFSKDGILFGNVEYKEKIDNIEKIEVLETLICYPAGKEDISEYIVPNTVKRISEYAFYQCEGLIKVEVQAGVNKIGEYCFSECTNLKEAIVPEGIEILENGLFSYCTSLIRFKIPNSVTQINGTPFYRCMSLEKIEVDEKNVNFYDIEGVLFQRYKNGKSGLICYPIKKENVEESYIVPEDVIYVEYSAFYGNYTFKSIQFPKDVEMYWGTIEEYSNLDEVIIPGYGWIDWSFFTYEGIENNDKKLKIYCNYYSYVYENNLYDGYFELIVDDKAPDITKFSIEREENSNKILINIEAEDKIQTEEEGYVKLDQDEIDAGASVGIVGLRGNSYSFDGGENWQKDGKIEIDDSAENIKVQVRDALCNTTEYEREIIKISDLSATDEDDVIGVLWSDGILDIMGKGNIKDYTSENSPFYSHRNLINKVNISSEITSLGNYLFEGYINITGIEIPQSVTKIGKSVFVGCDNLIEINVSEENANYLSENGILFDKNKETLICYPAGKGGEAYNIPETVKKIDDSAFYGTKLKNIETTENIIKIGSYAFLNCSELEKIIITDKVTTIGEKIINQDKTTVYCRTTGKIYKYCQANSIRTEIDGVSPTIENIRFVYNNEEGKIEVIVDGAKDEKVGLSLKPYSFDGGQTWQEDETVKLSEVKELNIRVRDALENIEEIVVWDLSGDADVSIIAVLNIATGHMEITGSGNIKNYYEDLKEGRTEDDLVPFDNYKDNVKTAKINDGIKNVGYRTFNKFSKLEKVEIAESVERIGHRVFFECSSLKEIKMSQNISYINIEAFKGCSSLKNIDISEKVDTIERSAFEGCTSLEKIYVSEKVSCINESVFKDCTSLTDIEIPFSINKIESNAFDGCTSLEKISIPDNVVTFGDNIFKNCTNVNIYCKSDSLAKEYAEENGISYSIDDAAPIINSVEDISDSAAGLYRTPYSLDGGNTWTKTLYIENLAGQELRVRDRLNNVAVVDNIVPIINSVTGDTVACTETILTVTASDEYHSIEELEYSYDNGNTWTTENTVKITETKEVVIKVRDKAKNETSMIKNVTIGHNWSDWTVTIEEACTKDGEEERLCSRCNKVEKQKRAALGHDNVNNEAKEATCTEIGWDAYDTCTRCDYTTYLEKPANGHVEVIDARVELTCTTAGKTEGKHCLVCNEVLVAQEEIPANGHTEIIDVKVEPTCTVVGKTEGKHCLLCSEVLVAQEEIPALGHIEVVDIGIKATCTVVGKTEGKHCSVCNEVLVVQQEIPALGHIEVVDAKVDPTCIMAGKTEGKHCSVCNEVLVVQQEIPALGHIEVVDEMVFPTCTEMGKTEGKHCSVCNEVLVKQDVILALGHTETVDAKVDPTCTKEGKTEGKYCSACNLTLVEQKTIPALGHTEVVDAAIEPTCTVEGKTEGKHCSVCNEILVKQEEISIKGHIEGETKKENNVDPTCIEKGSYNEVVYCTVCGEELSRNKIEVSAKGHTEVVDAAIEPTCIVVGKTEGKHCSVCNEVLVAQTEIPSLGHTEVIDAKVEPTCTVSGKTEGKHCSVCNEVLVAQKEIPSLGHTEVVDAKVEPTCTVVGKTEGKHCSVCNEVLVLQTEIPSLGHTEVVDQKVEPTCTVSGKTEGKHCSVCNEVLVKQEEIPALGHTEVIDEKIEPTCTVVGKTEGKYCSVCNEVLVKQEEIPALGHIEVIDKKIEPTCTTVGKTEGKHCSVCDEVLVKQEEIPALGHIEVIDEKIEPTCTTVGKTEGKHCSVCNEVLVVQQEIPALGHIEVVDEMVFPTCTEMGKTEGKHCSVCNEVLIAQKTIAPLGHSMSEWVVLKEATCTDNGTKERYCNVCGENEISVIAAKGHIFGTWITTREATTTQSGEEQRTCSECGTVQTRVKVYKNPKTGDIIMISVISSVIAIIGIVVTTKILNQKKKES